MERYVGERGGIGLGGADNHVAIHQRRIDADDLEREALDKADRQCSLARGGRAHEENGGRMAGYWLGGRLSPSFPSRPAPVYAESPHEAQRLRSRVRNGRSYAPA